LVNNAPSISLPLKGRYEVGWLEGQDGWNRFYKEATNFALDIYRRDSGRNELGSVADTKNIGLVESVEQGEEAKDQPDKGIHC
jgi:hypothetical protein